MSRSRAPTRGPPAAGRSRLLVLIRMGFTVPVVAAPALESNRPSHEAAGAHRTLAACNAHASSVAAGPCVGEAIALSSPEFLAMRAALDAFRWPSSLRKYVPGRGFCIGASLNRRGPICTKPYGPLQHTAVLAVNALFFQNILDLF